MSYEYRIRWQRHRRETDTSPGPVNYSCIRQSEKAAREKIERLVALDEDKARFAEEGGHNPFDFPDLIGKPTLERREVGAWEVIE